jgi:hypothetical protein
VNKLQGSGSVLPLRGDKQLIRRGHMFGLRLGKLQLFRASQPLQHNGRFTGPRKSCHVRHEPKCMLPPLKTTPIWIHISRYRYEDDCLRSCVLAVVVPLPL